MGCLYDHLAVDRLPDSCVDTEFVAEFDTSGAEPDGSWPYFLAPNATASNQDVGFSQIENADIDVLAREGKGYFATREWHIQNCLFTWRKQFRVARHGGRLEPWNDHEEHIKHCSDYIMKTI